MNTMKIPEFTAEASIYKTNEHYHSAGTTIASDAATESIAPAAFSRARLADIALRQEAVEGASCYCPCCIISGGILWCC